MSQHSFPSPAHILGVLGWRNVLSHHRSHYNQQGEAVLHTCSVTQVDWQASFAMQGLHSWKWRWGGHLVCSSLCQGNFEGGHSLVGTQRDHATRAISALQIFALGNHCCLLTPTTFSPFQGTTDEDCQGNEINDLQWPSILNLRVNITSDSHAL